MVETKIDVNKTGLIVIDMQNVFIKAKAGLFAEFSKKMKSNGIIENTAKVIDIARKVKIPIVHIRLAHRRDYVDFVYTIKDSGNKQRLNLIEGTWETEIIDELKPSIDDFIIIKRRNNAFYNTDLELLLRSRGIDTLIIAGIMTNSCVNDTVIGARERDYHVIVLSDCCATTLEETHEYWIKNVFPRRGRVRKSGEIIDAILASTK
ncbi:isochorismatase family cysteine hydrolase [Chloroflexota bacterium]